MSYKAYARIWMVIALIGVFAENDFTVAVGLICGWVSAVADDAGVGR